MQFDERKRKLIISGTICSAKKRFSPVNLLSPDSIQEGEEKNIKAALHQGNNWQHVACNIF
jgi:hypothetical protein